MRFVLCALCCSPSVLWLLRLHQQIVEQRAEQSNGKNTSVNPCVSTKKRVEIRAISYYREAPAASSFLLALATANQPRAPLCRVGLFGCVFVFYRGIIHHHHSHRRCLATLDVTRQTSTTTTAEQRALGIISRHICWRRVWCVRGFHAICNRAIERPTPPHATAKEAAQYYISRAFSRHS